MNLFRKLINFSEWGKISGKNSGSLRALAHSNSRGKVDLSRSKTWQDAVVKLREHLFKEILQDKYERLRFLGMADYILDHELCQVLSYDFQSSTLYLKQRGKSDVEIKKGSYLASHLIEEIFY